MNELYHSYQSYRVLMNVGNRYIHNDNSSSSNCSKLNNKNVNVKYLFSIIQKYNLTQIALQYINEIVFIIYFIS